VLFASPLLAQQELTVFAAASLTETFTLLGKEFEAQHPGVTVRCNFAGSQVLATQLEQGARADVLATADQRWMRYAADRRLLEGEARVFARNRLVVVIPRSNPGYISRLQDLARPGLKLILAGAQVPAGAYSREALARLAAAPGFPKDFAQLALQNLVSEEENVKAVVAKVQLREADVGIAYGTDVLPALRSQITLLEIPDPSNPIAEYPIAPVAGGKLELAAQFIAYVESPAGQRVLRAAGFLPPAGGGD
jgi:molybdate transport system substrate-binding protein